MRHSKKFYAEIQSRSYTAAVYSRFNELNENQQVFLQSVVYKAICNATIENQAGVISDSIHHWVISDLKLNAPSFDTSKVSIFILAAISSLVEQGKVNVESTRFCKLLTVA